MNHERANNFELYVRQIVQPIEARAGRKRMMREELLAHLLAVYEEEAERLGDERAAQRAARRRFGNSMELGRQLQASVPSFERILSKYLFREETVMSRWLIAGIVAVLVIWVFAFPDAAEFAAGALTMLAGVGFVHLCRQNDWLGRRWPWFVGVLAIACGPALIMPALAKLTEHGNAPPATDALPFMFPILLGALITLSGFGCLAYGIKTLRAPLV